MSQSMPSSGYWSSMTTADFKRLNPARTIAVLPVSACEQHGPHLPLSTDAVINAGVVSQMLSLVDASVTVLVLPAQQIGDSIEHSGFPGTLTADFDVLVKSWLAIGAGVHRAGLNKMLIFNTHGGQRGHVDQAAVRLRVEHQMLVARVNIGSLGQPEGLFDLDEKNFGLHGGDIETSLMMCLAPELVRTQHQENFQSSALELARRNALLGAEKPVGFGWMAQDLNSHGVTGNAANADAAKGEQLLAHMASNLAHLCRELADAPPDMLQAPEHRLP